MISLIRRIEVSLRIILTLTLLLGLVSCGGNPPPKPVARELSASEARAFDGGVDLVNKPSGLQGRWRRDWESDLKVRVKRADLVAVVHVQALRTAFGEAGKQHRLVVRVSGTIKGDAPGSDITLPSSFKDEGYRSVEANRDRIAGRDFLLYLRWLDIDGKKVPHWHLSIASSDVLGFSQQLLDRD